MRLRDTLIISVCISLAAFLLISAGMWLDYINNQREQMDLIINKPENVPPTLAFATVATGAFRGLVVDVLWMRADKLKEQGQFFDAKQLAEWITILQPRFASVWEFQAWNMAYNISVAIPATQPDQRWLWIRNGYELLRDRGIKWNPNNIALYRELARIFQHKIGGVTDDAHKYYKLQLALAMEPLLGPADNEYFQTLTKTPTNWQDIVKDADVAQLIKALKSADDAFSSDSEFVSNYLLLRQNASRFKPAAAEVIDDFRGTETLKKFDFFAKANYLLTEWKLEPALMYELNKTYGPVDFAEPNSSATSVHLPLDWRHPDTHAIYWAVRGLQHAGSLKNIEKDKEQQREIDVSETNTDRIVVHSLQNLFRQGKIFIYDELIQVTEDSSSQPVQRHIKEIFLRPDLRMFEPYNNAMLAVLDKYEKAGDRGSLQSLGDGHRNMLKNAVFSFYQSGHKDYAQKIYAQLKKRYPRPEFDVPLVSYVRNRLRDELEGISLNDATEMVQMMLRESYFRYAMRDDEEAAGLENIAMEVHKYYQSMHPDEYRIDLPEFSLLRYFALMDFLNDRQYPPTLGRNLIGRINIEKPELAKQLEQQEQKLIEQEQKMIEQQKQTK